MQLYSTRQLASFVVALLSGFVVSQYSYATVTAGSISGQFDVTPTGAAQYMVPLAVPPGTAGMVPSLSLSYNSQGGNGLLGMGWSLAGLSAITRCPKNIIQDGSRTGVNYDNNDLYCLDGQRLIPVSQASGYYGSNSAEYRTVTEGFSRIISYGSSPCPQYMYSSPSNGIAPPSSTCPAWFKVWTKSGQIMEFGNTADSAIEAQGSSVIRIWAVNKITDTKGNYLTVSYTEDNTSGQYYPSRIDYTGNASAGLVPYNSVRFVYATRPDVEPVYDGGFKIQNAVRLADIQTWANVGGVDTKVKDYSLAYDNSIPTQRSRLISLTECDGASPATCLPPTNFGWPVAYSSGNGFTAPAYSAPALPVSINGWYTYSNTSSYMLVGDFNGDGKMDYMWMPQNGDGRWLVAYSTGTGFTQPDYNAPALPLTIGGLYTHSNTPQNMQVGDFNGDGKADYMWMPYNGDGRWLIAYSTGTGFTQPDYNAPAMPNYIGGYETSHPDPKYMFFGDFNGDGKADYMWVPHNSDGRWLVAYSTGTGFTQPSYSSPAIPLSVNGYYSYNNSGQYMRFGDFNGDGKTDYMWQPQNGDGRWLVAYSTGTGFTQPNYSTPALPFLISGGYETAHPDPKYMSFGDFNGDGKMDYMWVPHNSDGRWLVAYSTGNGFTQPNYSSPAIPLSVNGYYSYNNSGQYMRFGDFNGDGKTDYMWMPQNGDGRWLIAYSTGTGFTQPDYNAPSIPLFANGCNSYNPVSMYMRHGDFDGDGKTDYMWMPNNGDGRWVVAYSTSNAQLISGITSGLGAVTTVAYKSMTDSSVYTKESGAVYPYVDVQAPMYVVSSVSSSDGIGGNYVSNYTYAGAKSHLTGGGFLGYRQTTNTDAQTGIVSKTTYRQDYPYQGLPLTAEKRTAGGVLLNNVSNTWSFDTNIAWCNQYHFSKITQSVESSYELTGALISTVTTNNVYDAYGNPTSITVSTPDGYSKTTTNTYINDLVNWYLGRLTGATVTSTAP